MQRTDPNDNVTTYNYDMLDRCTLVSYPDGTGVAYEYDVRGNRVKETHNGGLGDITYKTYDGLGRLESVVTDYGGLFTKTITYSYDSLGNCISITTDSKVTNYEYDPVNRLITITDIALPPEKVTTYEYDQLGRKTKKTLPNGTYTTYSYDSVGNLLNVSNKKSDGFLISSYTYTYDKEGNRMSMTDSYGGGGTFLTSYIYDAKNQLTDIMPSWAPPTQYIYDGVGNRMLRLDNGLPTTSYVYDSDNRLITAGADSYTYDENGNSTSKTTGSGETTTYEYNYENKMTQANRPSGVPVTFQYSAAGGRRLTKTASPTLFSFLLAFYCPICCNWTWEVLSICDHTGAQASDFIWGSRRDQRIGVTTSTGSYYYLEDGLGNVTQIVDAYENLAVSYEYDAFGNSTEYLAAPLDNAYRFTGREFDDEIGLSYNNARYYDPEVGRFTTQDPLMPEPAESYGASDIPSPDPSDREKHHSPPIQEGNGENLYSYVGNNPVNRVDPQGLYWQSVKSSSSSCGGGCGSCDRSTFYSPNGQAWCDLDKSPGEPVDTKVNNKRCTAPCTKAHEDRHAEDIEDCCNKARGANAKAKKDARARVIAGYRKNGKSGRTLQKNIKDMWKDKKAQAIIDAATDQVKAGWKTWADGARNWTECNAFGASVECANGLYRKYNCQCPPKKHRKCCREIKKYKERSEEAQEEHCGADDAQSPPQCPF